MYPEFLKAGVMCVSNKSLRKWVFVPVIILICAAGYLAGWYFGGAVKTYYVMGDPRSSFADSARDLLNVEDMIAYFLQDPLTPQLCNISGLAAGAVWCIAMLLFANRGVRRRNKAPLTLIPLGSLIGIIVGVLCALVIHISAQNFAIEEFDMRFSWSGLYVGSLFGLIVGAVVGLSGGVLFWATAAFAVRKTK